MDVTTAEAFITSELSKRQFVAVFYHDKTVSALTGRPPLLGRRSSTCQLPLDLSDEELIVEEPELTHIRSRLDPNGWNTSGKVYASTWARALLLMNLIREEVLEVSLSISNDCSELIQEFVYPEPKRSHVQERCADIIRRSDAVYASFPPNVRFNAEKNMPTTAHIFPR